MITVDSPAGLAYLLLTIALMLIGAIYVCWGAVRTAGARPTPRRRRPPPRTPRP